MPSRHILKIYVPDSYYHVFNRGVNKSTIFYDKYDNAVFLNLLKRHLGRDEAYDKSGRPYVKLRDKVELLAYCLMPNHFHLLFYQKEQDGITDLMRRVTTSYTMYFNKKYSRIGPLCQSRFKASHVNDESYLWHISRYIHLNPLGTGRDYKKYEASSYQDYVGKRNTDWLDAKRIIDLHEQNVNKYEDFVADFVDYKKQMKNEKIDMVTD